MAIETYAALLVSVAQVTYLCNILFVGVASLLSASSLLDGSIHWFLTSSFKILSKNVSKLGAFNSKDVSVINIHSCIILSLLCLFPAYNESIRQNFVISEDLAYNEPRI